MTKIGKRMLGMAIANNRIRVFYFLFIVSYLGMKCHMYTRPFSRLRFIINIFKDLINFALHFLHFFNSKQVDHS